MTKIMAHRGARNLFAENSLQGFRKTAALGFEAIEFDLHLTDTGELVVIHDATIDRTTDGQGLTRSLTDAGRKTLRLRGPDGVLIDEGVPVLAEALDILAPCTSRLYVELKCNEAGITPPEMVGMAADILRDYGLQDRAVLHSFDIEVVRQIRDEAPDFGRLISVDQHWADRQGGIAAFLEEVAGLVDIIGINHALFEDCLDLVRDMDLMDRCSVWTLNDAALIAKWLARKPAYLVSDDPVLVRKLQEDGVPA